LSIHPETGSSRVATTTTGSHVCISRTLRLAEIAYLAHNQAHRVQIL
jgi:hypothetical protein